MKAAWSIGVVIGGVGALATVASVTAGTLTFQEGVAGYAGTEDTFFGSRAHEYGPYGTETTVKISLWDPETTGSRQQALLRFGNMIGFDTGQVEPDSIVSNATLYLTVTADGGGEAHNLHKMLIAWPESVAYNSSAIGADGVQTSDVEASSRIYADSAAFATQAGPSGPVIPNSTVISYDVTELVQDWVNGDGNFGVVLDGTDPAWGDGLLIHSSESTTTNDRPKLVVESGPDPDVWHFREGLDGYSGTKDTWFGSRSHVPGEYGPHGTEDKMQVVMWAPSGSRKEALVRFDDIFGTGAEQIDFGAAIDRAVLTLTVGSGTYDDGEAHNLHKMLIAWPEGVSYNSSSLGGDGVETNDVEASSRIYADSSAFATAVNGSGKPVIPIDTVVTYDVTDIVRDWALGDDNFGFLLDGQDPTWGDTLQVCASEHTNATRRPLLTIDAQPNPLSRVFQDGLNGYAGTKDTWFGSRGSFEWGPYGTSDSLTVSRWSTARKQALVGFDNIFGAGPNQVRDGADIGSARLFLSVSNDGEAHNLHKMLIPWDESVMYTSGSVGGNGVQTDDVDASSRVYADCNALAIETGDLIPLDAVISYDVTEIVQDWALGGGNFGFLLDGNSDENSHGLVLRSSESPDTDLRPKLLIIPTPRAGTLLLLQ